ncbi:hypothetical protein OXB_1709 [Bacillus sp. OxB-1]|uniref:hypothetical protein n=1 Tax=Bacillus sp. (strain OxB-1) TaxID=98228 RepID=UPI00058222B7|nr:hypothetical protein [Bacillus sp. OxB-1]BAQ10180.1 hypothetical protein OXB_1709 [Bacillus sp. OxB-1]
MKKIQLTSDIDLLKLQLAWCKRQDQLLEEISNKLHEMKRIAQYAAVHELSQWKAEELNGQLQKMKKEIERLEKKLEEPFANEGFLN